MIGGARSEKADVSLSDDIVELLGGVQKGGTPIDDALGSLLELIDMILSTVCEFYKGCVRVDSKVERKEITFCVREGKDVVEEIVRELKWPVHTAVRQFPFLLVEAWQAVKWDGRKWMK
jgi:hypothetical protein